MLLVAGHGADGTRAFDASMVHTLGQIGEALLATGARWQVRRLRAGSGERLGADRTTIKREIDDLVNDDVRVAILVVLGAIVDLPGGPALVTGPDHRTYPEDATLPLAWIGDRLRGARAPHIVALVSGRATSVEAPFDPDLPTEKYTPPPAIGPWLAAIGTPRASDVIAVDAVAVGAPLADALLAGLCGDALDPRTGTVTFKSVSEHLARRVPRASIQASIASETVSTSPPLAGLWDVRRSQLSAGSRIHTVRSDEDLVGTVLPGRFRVDTLVARGTFGTVYRARQLAVDRDVAIKVLHPDIDPASDDGRLFVHEIRSVGRIDHANVVRIHQADITHDGRLFFAMELLEGRDLQALATADGAMPPERAVSLVRDLLAGLGAAHDAGLVHADVKPANAIVVSSSARVVLVDFGLARLRPPDRPADSAGGTPAFMAPEQLQDARVDARSDLFSAALVLVFLLTGWRRTTAKMLVPPAGTITDPTLIEVLARALELDPAKRYQTAAEFAAALGAPAQPSRATAFAAVPFRHLEALTEHDVDRFHGRDDDLAVVVDHALYGRSVIYTAPSGTGKTSLLRAGLVPRLDALGITAIYVRCRDEPVARIAGQIWPGATTLAAAITQHHAQRTGGLVLVLDQLEAVLATPDGGDLVRAIVARDDVAAVLSVREDHLARLVAIAHPIDPAIPIVRLPPLGLEGARAAIAQPLARVRLAIEPELMALLLADLEKAAVALGRELGWGATPAVYPPHLQLACSTLYEALAPDETTLTVAHYKTLGGFDAIVGEYLERVLDTELAEDRVKIARDLFVAFVTATHERAAPSEAALIESLGGRYSTTEITAVLEILRARGLLVRVRIGGDPRWEVVHDSLVPRVIAWLDRTDLARRRAVELVRYHVRRSRPEAPSLLGRDELRELRAHGHAIAELDAEWKTRGDDQPWTPARLLARSRAVLRNRMLAMVSVVVGLGALASFGFYRSQVAEAETAREQALRAQDLGRFRIELAPFDWDPRTLTAHEVAVPDIAWELHYPDAHDRGLPGAAYRPDDLVRVEGSDEIDARGGRAVLVVTRRGGTCGPSIIGLDVPGYSKRELHLVLHLPVPTCAASRADTIAIPAGPFIFGGAGDPPAPWFAKHPDDMSPEKQLVLPAFAIDRTEVTNAAFARFATMAPYTGIAAPTYPKGVPEFHDSGGPSRPVTAVMWPVAHAYCRFMGKQLPTVEQWQKALRGGETIGGVANPMPRRNLPWGAPETPIPANIHVGDATLAPVGSFPRDRSPYGVMDLAGNAQEWTSNVESEGGLPLSRGGNFLQTEPDQLLDYLAIENQRPAETLQFHLGMRCVAAE